MLLPFWTLALLSASAQAHYFFSDEFIQRTNEKATTWTAGRNFHEDTSLDSVKRLLGVLETKRPYRKHSIVPPSTEKLPEEFDSRIQWPDCPTIREIRDQAKCGSCWAMAVVETISDVICIHSNGTQKPRISEEYMIACSDAGGCDGGNPYYAFKYWRDHGVVTGGPYGSNEGCQPYSLKPCEHYGTQGDLPPCGEDYGPTPQCHNSCRDGYSKSFEDDKFYGESVQHLKGEESMMTKIKLGGPIPAAFHVYADFFHYKSGVYQRTSNDFAGMHAIKIIGWGVEKGTKYWLVANSWNTDWGDKGFFKILRGSIECGIEDFPVSVIPRI